jgi:tetratricopeptide (TPR) repeat protein
MALYDAFISYSHANDKPIAAALQSVIQKLGKPWYRRRALRVFRDDTSLSATPHLWPSIERALSESRYFILLASPEAAESNWVNKEVAHWLDHNSIDSLLIGLTDGELAWSAKAGDFSRRKKVPLPPALKGQFNTEPKWVDLRNYRNDPAKADAKFTELAADFAATVRGMAKEDLLSQELRQQRRALTLAWSGVGTLTVLVALAAWQWREAESAKQIAIVQRDAATRNFKLAHEAADRLVTKVAQELGMAVGTPAEAVRSILEAAQGTLDQLANIGPDDEELQFSRSFALREAGALQLKLGDRDAALKALRESLAIAERFAARNPDSQKWQEHLAGTYEPLGDALAGHGQLSEALDAYGNAIAIAKRVTDSNRSNGLWQFQYLASRGVADLLLRQGKLEAAQQAYRECARIAENRAASTGENRWQRAVALADVQIGETSLELGRFDQALAAARASVSINEKLVAAEPSNREWQRDMANARTGIGRALLGLGRNDEALTELRGGLAIFDRLAGLDPNNAILQSDVIRSYVFIGDILAAQGKPEEALKAYNQGLSTGRLAVSDVQRFIWITNQKVGNLLRVQGKLDDAVKAMRTGITVGERLVDADRSNVGLQRDLSMAYSGLANTLTMQNKPDEAIRAYRQSLAIADHSLTKQDVTLLQDVSMSHFQLGSNLFRTGNASEALEETRKARDIMAELSAMSPDNPHWKLTLNVLNGEVARAESFVRSAPLTAPTPLNAPSGYGLFAPR